MTYCVGLILDSGMIFASDSRTNAGVDHVATHSKMKVFERPGERMICVMNSGNLAITQGVINILEQNAAADDSRRSLMNTPSMYDAAILVGEALREMQRRDGPTLMQQNIDYSASLMVGGQIAGERQRLFNIYTQGNFIEAGPDTPYFQIGESKYGKPIIDRVIGYSTPFRTAAKCVLISFDSTIRSNISVGLPVDLLYYERDTLRVSLQHRVVEGDPYFNMIRQQWGEGLRRVFASLPDPDWGNPPFSG